MLAIATQPQTISKTLDSSFKLFFSGFKNVYLLSLVASVVIALPNLFNPALSEDPTQFDFSMLGTYFLWLIPTYLLYLIFCTAIYERLGFLNDPDQPSLGESLQDGLKGLLPVCLATIFYGVAIGLGTILLIIPGIYVAVSLALFWPAIVMEGHGPIAALKQSHHLIRGNWFRSLTIISIPTLSYVLVGFLQGLVAGFFLVSDSGASLESSLNSGTLLAYQFIMVPIYAAILPLYFAATIVLYRDLTLRKKGSDLEARLEWNESST